MGFDVSYHPISEEEINHWYFDVLEDPSIIDELSEQFEIHEFYQKRYKEFIQDIKSQELSDIFDITHGISIAITQGFVRKYFYTRGSAFSFLFSEYPQFKEYTKEWKDILHKPFNGIIHNKINENYSSGVFIPNDKVEKLLNDYKYNDEVKNILDNHYSHKRISVFLNSLNFAREHGLGLLEATDVIMPNPLDLNNSTCYSNLFNCDIEGALLYQEAAFEQLDGVMKEINETSEKELDSNNMKFVHLTLNNVPDTEMGKISFWTKIKNFFLK